MKIAYFVTEFPYTDIKSGEITYLDGGTGAVALQLARSMADRGHQITVYTTSCGSEPSKEHHKGMEVIRCKRNFIIGQAPISLSLFHQPFQSNLKPDIVHTHMGNLPAPLAALRYIKRKKMPLVTTYHGDAVGGFGSISRRIGVFLFNKFICDYILGSSDRIIALSSWQEEHSPFLRRYKEKIEIIPNGINPFELEVPLSRDQARRELYLPIDSKIILFLGNLTPIKGPHILFDALPFILKEESGIYTIFAGDGSCRKPLIDKAHHIGIEPFVRFPGKVYGRQKALYYKAADIFILPSLSEGLPLVLLEASVVGLPIIISDLDVLRPLIQNERNGLIAAKGNSKDFAEKILMILRNEQLRQRMSSNIKTHFGVYYRHLTWDKIAKQTEELYNELI